MALFDFFRRAPEEKASVAGSMMVLGKVNQAQWTKRNLERYALDGFQRNPVVYRATRLIAENAASLPIIAMKGEKEVAKHPAVEVLMRPNPFTSGRAQLEALYSFRCIAGNAFMEAVTIGKSVRELHVHRPERVKVVPGSDGYPAFYEFQINGQTRRVPVSTSDVSTVLHLKDFNPLDDWYGQSPLEAASWAIDGHGYGSQEIATTLQSGGRTHGALNYDGEKPLLEAQMNEAGEAMLKRIQEARRSRAPMMLNKFWKWVEMGAKPHEMHVTELKADAAREICFALGVPPMLLGIPGDNTYANYAEANRAFWRETVIPMATKNLAEIGSWMGRLTGEDDLTFVPNLDGLPALADETSMMWTRLNSAEFITINEKREATGYKPVDGADDILVSSADVPLSMAGDEPQGGAEPDPNVTNEPPPDDSD